MAYMRRTKYSQHTSIIFAEGIVFKFEVYFLSLVVASVVAPPVPPAINLPRNATHTVVSSIEKKISKYELVLK